MRRFSSAARIGACSSGGGAHPLRGLEHSCGAAAPIADVRVHWLDDSNVRSQVLAVVFRAERERFRSRRLHTELFDAIRFDVGWKGPAETGLPPGSLEVEPPLRAVFRALRHWPLQRVANTLGAAQLLALRAPGCPLGRLRIWRY